MASKATRPLESNADIVRALWETGTYGDYSLVDQYVADDYVEHSAFESEPIRGRDGFRANIEEMRAAFSDIDLTIEDIFAAGDEVALRWRLNAKHTGDLRGIAPTNKPVEISGIEIDRFEDGKVVEAWNQFDSLGMLQQMGALPDEMGS
ncbi:MULTISPECIES: ester cyclase [unclassified Haladaptatus]|uniref:ester cyclase n=1 Tax=unclassified Haladaptatus TaxID=2622732 RepID=UPI0023E85819|nr:MULTISPECIES: ester cyclase [unclassified Haladaptatus]